MTDAVRIAQPAAGPAAEAAAHRTHHHAPAKPHAAFQEALLHASHAHGTIGAKTQGPVRHAVARVPAPAASKPAAVLPAASVDGLSQAMTLEGVPASWQSGLSFIMARESGGRVDAKSPIHSARGLYQLTAANYHYNPQGAASFGNAVEEARGGIRYIRARYGNADNAVAFWRQHRWY